jgi:hypothetical protein
MSDVEQTESGADVNALRYNIPVGESREYVIAASRQISADVFTIAAVVSGEGERHDVDVDNCTVPAGTHPMKGETWVFTHNEAGVEAKPKE